LAAAPFSAYADADFDGFPAAVADVNAAPTDPQGSPTTHLNTTQAGQQITRDNYHWGSTLGAAAGTDHVRLSYVGTDL